MATSALLSFGAVKESHTSPSRAVSRVSRRHRPPIDATAHRGHPSAMARPKRDHAYYLRQLKVREPDVFARFEAGEFASAAAALIVGGIRSVPKPINVLERAWKNASATDRDAFLSSIGAAVGLKAGTIVLAEEPTTSEPIANPDRTLTALTVARINKLYPDKPFPCGVIMGAIGFTKRDASLGRAMTRPSRIRPEMIDALTLWLPAEEARRRS